MKKQSRKVAKRCLAFLMVLFLLSINSFAAVVSDNDGSAFITKAEFDSLKNNFQSQIDQYNTSIDSKIDGAIAQYLAGIREIKEIAVDSILDQTLEFVCFSGIGDAYGPTAQTNGILDIAIHSFWWSSSQRNGAATNRWQFQNAAKTYNFVLLSSSSPYNPICYYGNLDMAGSIDKLNIGNNIPSFSATNPPLLVMGCNNGNPATNAMPLLNDSSYDKWSELYTNTIAEMFKEPNDKGTSFRKMTWNGSIGSNWDANETTFVASNFSFDGNTKYYKWVHSGQLNGSALAGMNNLTCKAAQVDIPGFSWNTEKKGALVIIRDGWSSASSLPKKLWYPGDAGKITWSQMYGPQVGATSSSSSTWFYRPLNINTGSRMKLIEAKWTSVVYGDYTEQSGIDTTCGSKSWTITNPSVSLFHLMDDVGGAGARLTPSVINGINQNRTIFKSGSYTIPSSLGLTQSIPVFYFERAGQAVIDLKFIDNTTYDVWFSKTPLSTSTLPTASTSGLLIPKEGVQSNGSMLCNQSQTATFNVADGTMIYILAVKHGVKGGAILDLTQTTAKEFVE